MHRLIRTLPALVRSFVVVVTLFTACMVAHSQTSAPARATMPLAPLASDKDLADTQGQLIKLLRLSPTLTTVVVASDPSLLANQDYVSRNNPAACAVPDEPSRGSPQSRLLPLRRMDLADHRPEQAHERAVMRPNLRQTRAANTTIARVPRSDCPSLPRLLPFSPPSSGSSASCSKTAAGAASSTCRRDVHGKLIDRFGNNEELLSYMDTEAGKRFLEAAPIPVDFEREQRVPKPPSPACSCPSPDRRRAHPARHRSACPSARLARHRLPSARLRHDRPDARPRVYHLRRHHLAARRPARPHAAQRPGTISPHTSANAIRKTAVTAMLQPTR